MTRFDKDTLLSAEVYYIESYNTVSNPYEGHYLHYNTKVKKQNHNIKVYKGDYIVPTNQYAVRYIVETLEPESDDSFFYWNFFDEILMQKEWFSDYIFEDNALQILNSNNSLKQTFEAQTKALQMITGANYILFIKTLLITKNRICDIPFIEL